MRPSLRVSWLLGVAAFAGCRDAPALFESPELEPLGPAPYQLTFSIDDDAAPAWMGDSLIYLAEDSALGLRVLRVIHREGGPAPAVFPEIQGGAISVTMEWAAFDPGSGQVAMTTLLSNHPTSLCGNTFRACMPTDETSATPSRLDSALVRVRALNETGPPDADESLVIPFEGRFFDPTLPAGGLSGSWVIDLYPFQKSFNETNKPPARPSWSPDGSAIAFSDGLQILTWTPGSAGPDVVPNTEDGIHPAWSPDGAWLAFEHLARGAESSAFCEYRTAGGALRCVEQRTEWQIDAREIVIVRPDGSDRQVLALGSEPAWSARGHRIYYASEDGIRSMEMDGSDDMEVPGTEGGQEPAVSADGRWLAFSIPDAGPRNIWIVELLP